MATFTSLITALKASGDYSERIQFLLYILNYYQNKKATVLPADKAELSELIFSETERLIPIIPSIEKYRDKDTVMGYANHLFGILMRLYASPSEIPEDKLANIEKLHNIIDKESFIENQIEEIFERGNNSPADIERLICMLYPLKDEFQKGQLYQGMLHFRDRISSLPEESRELIAKYIASELERYLTCELTEDVVGSLEFACDVCQFFIVEKIAALLQKILALGINNISYFAVSSLLGAGYQVPAETISALANDIVYADVTYAMLKKLGKTSLFPAELATPEYLAKSDMVHWLTYPTELGKVPDEIEYLGKVKKKEVYYIFRYRSDSDNLGNDLKGKWLIGWSSEDGGTFSNFDLYDNFVKKTPQRTLRYIRRKLL